MLERASEHLRDAPDGGARVVPSEERRDEAESLAATFALAVAAHQAGDDALSERLVRGGLGREHIMIRRGGEGLFWMIASGGYGVLGPSAERVTVAVDGARREVELSSGRAIVPIDVGPGGHAVRVESPQGAAFVRVEAVMERPFVARADGPFDLAIEGDAGDVATGGALELSVRATERVMRPIVELELPAGIDFDRALRERLASASGVQSVELREPGFVRLVMAPMNSGTTVTVALPMRWTVRGDLRGLGVIAYPTSRPEAMSALAPQRWAIEASTRR